MWNHYAVLIIPIAQQAVGNRIGRALDPDIGGNQTFTLTASADGNLPATETLCGTACRESFLQTVQSLVDNNTPLANRAAALKQMVDADYTARWPEEVPPTLAEWRVSPSMSIPHGMRR
jgi:phage-related tail fiber protein